MKRFAVTPVIAVVTAVVAAALFSGCQPGTRYIDQVFDSSTKSTAVFRTVADLNSGAPLKLHLDVYQPTGDAFTSRPVIVWIHGGGFKGGGRADFAKEADAYARRGYVTASIEYRLDPGNRCQDLQDGKIPPDEVPAETERCRRDIEAAQADSLAAIAWLRTKAATYGLDTTRFAVGGGSAGAVTAVNVAQRANADHGPVPARWKVSATLAMSGCQYDSDAIDANDAPVSLLASGGDQAVPFECTTATADKAESFGTPVQRLFYPAESGHARGLYLTHQAEVDQAWTAFLVENLHLPTGA